MKTEGRIFGCEACKELRMEEIEAKERLEKMKQIQAQAMHKKGKRTASNVEARKSTLLKEKGTLGKGIEAEPEWWGAGVSRVISVGPGVTFEQVESDICQKTYDVRKNKALTDRGVWIKYLKLLKKKYEDALSRSQGPDWFQDLSPRQRGLFDKLNEILEVDLQEDICSRTHRALCDIGIYPPLPKKDIKKCMKQCMGNIIRFLFMLHRLVVQREQPDFDTEYREAKDVQKLQRFSTNERLLLSGVFRLHFDEFTSKLDKLLPPSPEKSKFLLPKKVREPKRVYENPYLEPLPLPPKIWYEQRAEDDMYKEQARLVDLQEKKEFEEKVLKEAEEHRKAKEEKLRKLLEQRNYFSSKSMKKSAGSFHDMSIAHRENKSQIFKRFSAADSSSEGGEKSKSSFDVSKSYHHVRKNRRYMYDVVHETIQTRTSYGGFFSHDNKLLKDSEGANLKIRLVPRNDKVVCLYKDEDFKPVQILDTRVRTCCRDIGIQTSPEPMFLPVKEEPEFYKYYEGSPSKTDASTNTEHVLENKPSKIEAGIAIQAEKESSEKPLNIECTDETCALVERTIPLDEYDMVRRKIANYPPEKQLRAAVVYLCRRGDPLAVMPSIDETPWLVRWFERRRGIKVKLTQEEKDELLHISGKLWLNKYNKVSCVTIKPFKVKKGITSLERDWLDDKINKYKLDFQTRLRRQMVNNTRDYFPTFFAEYFTSPLNKTIRKTFFTYLPSKEMDLHVFRVWDQETKNAKPKESGDE